MPFDLDCRDRSEPEPGALDTMRQLARLTAIAEQLGTGELAVVVLVSERLLEGRRRYGALNLDADPRDFRRECFEELADVCVYLAADVLRGGGDDVAAQVPVLPGWVRTPGRPRQA